MNCPFCPSKKRGRRYEYELPELMNHIMDRHPMEFLRAGREILKETAIENTEVEYGERPRRQADRDPGPTVDQSEDA